MEDNYLQAGFEIKLACDALSRRILRWHWEKTPRPNSLKELMQYVKQRTVEAPDYYANSAVQSEKSNLTWQQLDTTFCMRVLLDSEANAEKPKRLLQYALQEGAARHACNGLRIARNAAAHATDKAGVVKAIATFDETLGDLERAYGLTLFQAEELAEYDALVARATQACKGKGAASKAVTSSTTPKAAAKTKTSTTSRAAGATKSTTQSKKSVTKVDTRTPSRTATKTATNTQNKPVGKTVKAPNKTATAKDKKATSTSRNNRKNTKNAGSGREKGFVALAVVIFLLAFLMQLSRM